MLFSECAGIACRQQSSQEDVPKKEFGNEKLVPNVPDPRHLSFQQQSTPEPFAFPLDCGVKCSGEGCLSSVPAFTRRMVRRGGEVDQPHHAAEGDVFSSP